MSDGQQIIMFGGINSKAKKHKIEEQPNKKKTNCSLKIISSDQCSNILNDLWIFDLKINSWHQPIIGGTFPKRSCNNFLVNLTVDNSFRSFFFSFSHKVNNCYELNSLGRFTD